MVRLYRLLVFKSAIPVDTRRPSHFLAPEEIQSSLKKVCDAWVIYLQDYINQTAKLFETPEHPWALAERPMVSSLAAAITRQFENSLAVEECQVPKAGKAKRGNCDLWVSIPDRSHDGRRFNFYLEAKKSRLITPDELSEFLRSREGLSRLLRDFKKGKKRKSPLSPYANLPKRKHEHYVIGMLVMPLKAEKKDSATVKGILQEFFQNGQKIQLRWKGSKKVKRDLGRLPTVAVAVLPEDDATLPAEDQPGMLAIFTVLGSSSELLAK